MTTSTTSILNKALRRHVSPILREHGFDRVDARNGWAWKGDDCIRVFNIRALGSYFSDVTGWPPSSVCVWLGVHYPFIPAGTQIKTDSTGRLLPPEVLCHIRSRLNRADDQMKWIRGLRNAVEYDRTDIWWVDRAGANADDVALDIASAVSNVAIPWYQSQSNLESVLDALASKRDSFVKFVLGAYLAERIGCEEMATDHRSKAEEADRNWRLRSGFPSANRTDGGWYTLLSGITEGT